LDRKFRHNFRKAQQYGLVRGAYHYFSPGISGDEQAHHFINNVPLEKGDLPPVLDVEVLGRLKPETLRREVLEWLEMMEKRFGTPPIIYTYLTFKKNYLNTPEFDRYPFWIAHYKVKKLRYKGAWDFWQHTEEGCIDGITANEDKCRDNVRNSIGIVTALNPIIGYKNSTKIAKEALETGRGVYDLIIEHGILSQEDLDTVLAPENMIKPVRLGIKAKK